MLQIFVRILQDRIISYFYIRSYSYYYLRSHGQDRSHRRTMRRRTQWNRYRSIVDVDITESQYTSL